MVDVETRELKALQVAAGLQYARELIAKDDEHRLSHHHIEVSKTSQNPIADMKTPPAMKALSVQQEINQETIRQVTELNFRVDANENARKDDTRRFETALNEVRDEISKSNVIAERTATASETRTKIAQDMVKFIKWFIGVAIPGIPAAAYTMWG
jgi:hypothetical protein